MRKSDNSNVHYLRVTLDTVRKMNQLLAEEKTPSELAGKVCELMVRSKGYLCSWMILLDEGQRMTHMYSAGCVDGLDLLKADVVKGKLPMYFQVAIEKRKLISFENSMMDCPLCVPGKKSWTCFIAPLQINHTTYGLLFSAISNEDIPVLLEKETYRNMASSVSLALASIKDQKTSKEERYLIKKSELKYKSLVDSLSDSLFIIQDGIIKYMNPALSKVFGYAEEEVVGKDYFLFSPGQERERIIEIHRKRLLGEKMDAVYETVGISKDGVNVPIEVNVTAIEFEGRAAQQVILRDISAYIEKTKKLSDSERLVNTLIQSMPSGFVLIGDDYKIYRINKRTSDVTGFAMEELVGQYCDVICPKGAQSKDCPVWENGQVQFTGMDTTIKCKDGCETPVLKNAQILEIDGKRYVLESFLDITVKKRAEEQLIKAKDMAEENDRLKSAFLANMSHEIRTPVNGILGFAELLKDPELEGDDQRKFVEVICKSGERMLNTINDIIDISKIETGSMKVTLRKVNLNALVSDLYQFFLPQATSKGLDLIVKQSESCVLEMFTDIDKINSILTNLLRNAIKFTEKGSIILRCRKYEREVELAVIDTGIGIHKERQTTIFDRFVQADTTTSKKYEGSGLGLAITKSFVEMLGGSILLASEQGKGSTFIVRLPLSEVQPDVSH